MEEIESTTGWIEHYWNISMIVGVIVLLLKKFELLVNIYEHFFRTGKNLKTYGSWAIVTGSTSGIGKGYALELAKKGLNIILLSRNEEKLKNVAEEIKVATKQNVKYLAVDFSNFDKTAQQQVVDFVKDLNVGILINNVGLSYEYPEYFENVDVERFEKIIAVNVNALTIMTRLIVPQMLAQKKGAVVNVSSAAAVIPHQLMIVYGSSKAYVNNFTWNCQLEMGSKGITFCVHSPFFVVSAMSKIRKPSFTVASAKAYAKSAVNQIGYPGVYSPYPVHTIMYYLVTNIPGFILEKVIGGMHKDIRKRALRKKERLAKQGK